MRPSRKTFDAVVAAFFDVTFVGLTCESALPAAVLDDLLVDPLDKTVDAFFAALRLVDLVAISLLRLLIDCALRTIAAPNLVCDA